MSSADEDGVDGKQILGKFGDSGLRGLLVKENHEFCAMEPKDTFEEFEGEATESIAVGNHNLLYKAAARLFQ